MQKQKTEEGKLSNSEFGWTHSVRTLKQLYTDLIWM